MFLSGAKWVVVGGGLFDLACVVFDSVTLEIVGCTWVDVDALRVLLVLRACVCLCSVKDLAVYDTITNMCLVVPANAKCGQVFVSSCVTRERKCARQKESVPDSKRALQICKKRPMDMQKSPTDIKIKTRRCGQEFVDSCITRERRCARHSNTEYQTVSTLYFFAALACAGF